MPASAEGAPAAGHARRLAQLAVCGRTALLLGDAPAPWTEAIAASFEAVERVPGAAGPQGDGALPGGSAVDTVFCFNAAAWSRPGPLLAAVQARLAAGGLAYLRFPGPGWAEALAASDREAAAEAYLARLAHLLDGSHLDALARAALGGALGEGLLDDGDGATARRRWLAPRRPRGGGAPMLEALSAPASAAGAQALLRRYADDEGEAPGPLARRLRACALAVWERVLAAAAGADGNAAAAARALERALVLASPEQRRRLCLDLFSRLCRGAGAGSDGPALLSPEEVVAAARGAALTEVGTAPVGWLVVDPSVEGPAQEEDGAEGWYESVLRKPPAPGSGDWPGAGALRAPLRGGAGLRQPAWQDLVGSLRRGPSVDRSFSAGMRTLAANFRDLPVLERLVEEVTGGRDDEAGFRALYAFVQDSLFHHPTVQPVAEDGSAEGDVAALLLGGIGRCGHVAEVARALFERLGCAARVTQLHRHLCAEVRFGGRWRIVDADAFKAGVHPVNRDGEWATLDDARADPALLDRVPALGLVLSPAAPFARDALGRPVRGYVDTGMPWQRPYPSHLYLGAGTGIPPRPPALRVERAGDGLRVRFGPLAQGTAALDVLVDGRSRGWSYADAPGPAFLAPPGAGIAEVRVAPGDAAAGVAIAAAAGPVFASVVARDRRGVDDPGIHHWPGDEARGPGAGGG